MDPAHPEKAGNMKSLQLRAGVGPPLDSASPRCGSHLLMQIPWVIGFYEDTRGCGGGSSSPGDLFQKIGVPGGVGFFRRRDSEVEGFSVCRRCRYGAPWSYSDAGNEAIFKWRRSGGDTLVVTQVATFRWRHLGGDIYVATFTWRHFGSE